MQPPSVGKDCHGAFDAAGGIDRDEAVVGWRPLGVANDQVLLLECLTERGGDLERFLVVDLGEQVDVFGRSVHEPCAIMAPPPARARARARVNGSANAVRAMRSCRGSSGMHSGCRARGVDEWLPRRA